MQRAHLAKRSPRRHGVGLPADRESGQSLVLVTIFMAVFLAIAAFVFDAAQLAAAHHQAQVAADSGALSAAQDMENTYTPKSTVVADGTSAAQSNYANSNVTINEESDQLHADASVTAPVNLPFGSIFGFGNGTVSARAVAEVSSTQTDVNGTVLSTVCSNNPCTYKQQNQLIPTDGTNQTTGWHVTSGAEEPTTNNYGGATSVNVQTCEGHQGNGQCYDPSSTTASTSNPWVVDLNGESEGGMWQTISTTAGARYVLNFWLTGNPALNGWPSASSNYFPVDVYVTDGANTQYTPSVNEGSPPTSPCSLYQPATGYITCGWWNYQDPVCNSGTAVIPSGNPAVSPAGLKLSCSTSGQEEAYFTEESLTFIAKSTQTTLTFNSEVYDNNVYNWFNCGPEVADIVMGAPQILLTQ